MTRLLVLQPHTTHDERGVPIQHAEGSTYELADEGVVETLVALGFARVSDAGPTEVQLPPKALDEHTAAPSGPSAPATPAPAVATPKKRK